MKPIIILAPNVMSDDNIKLLRENDLCVVVAENPALVRFVDPIPAVAQRTKIENAAIQLSRILLNKQWGDYTPDGTIGVSTFSRIFVDILLKGTPLDPQPTKAEVEERTFDAARAEELRKLAREEAKAERDAQKRNMKGSAAK